MIKAIARMLFPHILKYCFGMNDIFAWHEVSACWLAHTRRHCSQFRAAAFMINIRTSVAIIDSILIQRVDAISAVSVRKVGSCLEWAAVGGSKMDPMGQHHRARFSRFTAAVDKEEEGCSWGRLSWYSRCPSCSSWDTTETQSSRAALRLIMPRWGFLLPSEREGKFGRSNIVPALCFSLYW